MEFDFREFCLGLTGLTEEEVSNKILKKLKEIATERNISWTASWPDLIGRVDAVSLAVPTEAHCDLACRLLGAGIHVLRARDERIETGELRALEEGRALVGEVVTLKPRADDPRICDVEDSYTPPGTQNGVKAKGPAQVASTAYRAGWDQIFAPVGDRKPEVN